MHLLVLQHARAEHPGIFRDFLREDGHTYDAIELDEGETLPTSLDGYDALWVLGGPMKPICANLPRKCNVRCAF